MRICYLTEADLSIDNGRGINEREFVEAAIHHDRIDVVCVAPEPANARNYRRPEIEYVAHHGHSPLGYLRFVASAYRRIAALERGAGIDAVATRLDVSPLVPYAIHRRLDLPIVLKTLVGRQAFAEELRLFVRPHQLVKRLFRGMFRKTIERAACADTVSTVLAEELRRMFGFARDELIVLRNGANLDHFNLEPESEERVPAEMSEFETLLGYVGVLGDGRHLGEVIDAFASASQPGDGLVLVGDGPEREALEERVRQRSITDRVVFTGHIPYSLVPGVMRVFDAAFDLSAVEVSYDGPARLATYSQKIAQYLGCGCPVVAWDLEDTAFIRANDVGWTVPFGDVKALEEKIRTIGALNEGRRSAMENRARKYAETELDAKKLADKRIEFWMHQLDR